MPKMRKGANRSSESERLPVTMFLLGLPLALLVFQLLYHLFRSFGP